MSDPRVNKLYSYANGYGKETRERSKITKFIMLMENLDDGNWNASFTSHPLAKLKRPIHTHSKAANAESARPDIAVLCPINILRRLRLNRHEPAHDRVHKANVQRLAYTDQERQLPISSATSIYGKSEHPGPPDDPLPLPHHSKTTAPTATYILRYRQPAQPSPVTETEQLLMANR